MSKIRLGPKPFLLPQPAVLVGTLVDGRPNYMMAAWCGMANHAPPMLTVAVRPSRHTEAGIRQNQVFSVNIPPAGLVEKADCCGIVSGAQMDKGELFSIHYGVLGAAPLIEECRLGLECRLIQTLELPTHLLHVGEIVEVHADPDCLADGAPDLGLVDPLLYSITDGYYWKVGEKVAKAFGVGRALKKT